MTMIRDEYAPTFGRQHLTLWQGGWASDFVGRAHELPGHNGYMVELDFHGAPKLRVSCESPRTDENYLRVDKAIADAVDAYRQGRDADSGSGEAWQHDPSRDGAGCCWCGRYAQVSAENLCRDCH